MCKCTNVQMCKWGLIISRRFLEIYKPFHLQSNKYSVNKSPANLTEHCRLICKSVVNNINMPVEHTSIKTILIIHSLKHPLCLCGKPKLNHAP